MKCSLVLCLLILVSLSMAGAPRGCIYVNGRCYKGCPEGTHGYTPGCVQKVPEATCDEPNPVAERGIICDYSSCYCDSPTVRDTTTGKCVPLDQCPKKEDKVKLN